METDRHTDHHALPHGTLYGCDVLSIVSRVRLQPVGLVQLEEVQTGARQLVGRRDRKRRTDRGQDVERHLGDDARRVDQDL